MKSIDNADILKSWKCKEGNVNSTPDLLEWIQTLNEKTHVNIKECSIVNDGFWFYDDYQGEVLNRKRSFFSIVGMRYFVDGEFVEEQPIIVQPEIGYLGIICKKIDGVLNFLMQAKIEPGNVNCVQISPTIQATKSNFLRAHGGKLPTYFELFEQSQKYEVLYDQVQSEQASRFYKKRNRNLIMVVDEDIEIHENYKWMTLGQIKELMKIDNLVNMDTRTVLSGLPLYNRGSKHEQFLLELASFDDEALGMSFLDSDCEKETPVLFQKLNNFKMFRDVKVSSVPLNQLVDWKVNEYGVDCKKKADFCVRYYDIEIEGREVQKWFQPLFKAIGSATFGLLLQNQKGKKKVLVHTKAEIGCFDRIEFGPTVQWEPTHERENDTPVDTFVRGCLENSENIKLDVMLSEEGGRFYHEQNRNVILEIPEDVSVEISDEYTWVDFGTLNQIVQMHDCLNIQLRNMMSLMDI